MHVGLQIPSFRHPASAAIRPKLKEIVTTAEAGGFLQPMGDGTITTRSRACSARRTLTQC